MNIKKVINKFKEKGSIKRITKEPKNKAAIIIPVDNGNKSKYFYMEGRNE